MNIKMKKCKCGKTIKNFYAKQCQTCYLKNKYYPKGEEHSSYKKGKPKCIYCQKEIDYRAKMCGDCHHKLQRGKNHPSIGIKRPDLVLRNKLNPMKGRKNGMFGKLAKHGKRIKYKNICFRSSWEISFARWLDKNKIKWLYEPKTFDLRNCTYTPDFYLPENDLYIEVKGWWRDNAKKKFKIFKRLNPKIKILIIDKIKLKSLRLI